jgi:3',5'-cyclic AMP phosphodiesterase CpdA
MAAGPVSKPIKIAVMSDIHVYDPALGTTGAAFDAYLASQDNKLEAESEAIFQSALNIILNSDVQVVLIVGDLTNNGEYVNHQRVASYLGKLANAGKQVFVINGNHDIFNPSSCSYSGNTATRVKNTSPDEFRSLYHAFGYAQAVAKDANSLSYAVDLSPDVRLIVIDSCRYAASDTTPQTAGEVSGARLQWVENQIRVAKAAGKTVFGMMHHAIVPHFGTETTVFPGFVVDNYATLQQDFSSLGLQVVFTGHFHAQDLAGQYFADNKYVLDIGTGSLVNYPVPIRFVEVTADRKQLNITGTRVTNVNFDLKGAANFQTYARNAMIAGLKEMFVQLATGALVSQGVSSDTAQKRAMEMAATRVAADVTVGDLFVRAALAHYQGDENLDAATKAMIRQLASSSDPLTRLMGQNMLAMATDVPPADNFVKIDLRTGKATR